MSQGSRPPFGGFIGLPVPTREDHELHADGLFLASGRSCLRYILDEVRPARVHVPFYSCDSLAAPIWEAGISVSWYGTNEQLIPQAPKVHMDELIILVDHFGVRTRIVEEAALHFGSSAVIDDTHAFYSGRHTGVTWSFNSARKFLGVPDGGFLFGPDKVHLPIEINENVSFDHLILKSCGEHEAAYEAYKRNEARIPSRILRGNPVSEAILSHVDHGAVRKRRRDNFLAAHEMLGDLNSLTFELDSIEAPLCYPVLMAMSIDHRELHRAGMYIPRYWPEVNGRAEASGYHQEALFSECVLAFPIDQRYESGTIKERAWDLKQML